MEKKILKRRTNCFTLMEMAVVVAIIALTAAIVMPVYFNHVKKAKIGTAKAQISLLEQAIMDFRLDTGNLPTSLEDLNKNPGNDKWNGPYLQKAVPKDPWGNVYIYTVPGSHGDYDLVSNGSDGQPGGAGEAADLANWDAQP